jgi:hypothetical protein
MRRQVTPDAMPQQGQPMFAPQAQAPQAPMQMADASMGGAFGWTDPAEVPPNPELDAARQRFEASPTDENGMLLEQLQRQMQGQPPVDPRWIDGNMRMSGSGKMIADAGTAAGPQYAQADTGTMSDAGGKSMKLTEGQSKDLNFWNRMDAVTSKIDERAAALTDRGDQIKGAVPMFGNSLVSEDYQRGKRDADEWITALLRKDTGAAVTEQEWKLYGPIYIPQPGDGPGTLKDKAEARQRAAEGMKKGLGTAEVMANELAIERQKRATAPAAASDDWRSQDPSTWTDEQLQEYLK